MYWWDRDTFHEWVIVDRLADIILYYVKGCVVEIGIGVSTKILAKHAKNAGVKHYAIDTDAGKCERFEKKARHKGLVIYNGTSLDFIKTFDDTPALVFIDGCHDSEVVIQEAMFFIDRLPPGGVIFFHDMYLCEDWVKRQAERNRFSDTYRVRWELENLKDIWCFTFPYTARGLGLTMVLKKPEHEHTAGYLDLVGDHPRGPRMSGRYRDFKRKRGRE
jgi:hypothetical protein